MQNPEATPAAAREKGTIAPAPRACAKGGGGGAPSARRFVGDDGAMPLRNSDAIV
jgi:hypothetical protein